MLNCYILESPDLKELHWQGLLTPSSLWMVNDLESKFWVQRFLRNHSGAVIHSDRVKRASELWQDLLLKLDPTWTPISSQLTELLIEKWVVEILKENSLKISVKDSARAYQTIGQILPLLSHFQGQDVMGEWFLEQNEAKERWADWYDLGRLLWDRFLDKKLIPQEWMKGALVNEELPSLGEETLIVDLGLDIDDVESELILNLSRDLEVHVYLPQTEMEKEPYQNLLNRCQTQWVKSEDFALQDSAESESRFKKLPSMLAEVKEAVASVRKWLDEGVPLESVAIVSPQIENYWPTLIEHLTVEGVPVQKAIVTPLSQLPAYQDLMARLRLACEKLLSGDSEELMFKIEVEPPLDYRTFLGTYSNVYKLEDLQRTDEMACLVPKSFGLKDPISMEEFLEHIIEWVPQKSLPFLEGLIEGLDETMVLSEKFLPEKWLSFLERFLARSEKKISPASESGILVLPLKACQNPQLQRVAMIGLSESQLLENKDTALTWADIESIKLNFGFSLPHADRHVLEDHLRWLQSKFVEEFIFTHGETDFTGRYQSPSMFWLKGALEAGHSLELESPADTRWDEINRANPGGASSLHDSQKAACESFIQRDRGEVSLENVQYNKLSLSASSFEEFFKCPFKLFARKGLGLGNPPVLDLDIDYMTRGRLLHRICELVVKDELFNLDSKAIEELVDKAQDDLKVNLFSDQTWKFLRPYYLQATAAFINFERQWRVERPETKTIAVEKKIKTHLLYENGDVRFDSQRGIPFRGVIDRVDCNSQGQVVLIDYKTSGAGLTQFKSWVQNGKIQLALYSLALIEGVLEGQKHDVIGAFYFALKSLERNKGFAINEASVDFLPASKTQRQDIENLFDETRSLVGKMIEEISQGVVEPRPHQGDLKICNSCDWKRICRYPELNQ